MVSLSVGTFFTANIFLAEQTESGKTRCGQLFGYGGKKVTFSGQMAERMKNQYNLDNAVKKYEDYARNF